MDQKMTSSSSQVQMKGFLSAAYTLLGLATLAVTSIQAQDRLVRNDSSRMTMMDSGHHQKLHRNTDSLSGIQEGSFNQHVIHRRRNMDSADIDYGASHPFILKKKDKNLKTNRKEKEKSHRGLLSQQDSWYDNLFSIDDYLQDDWYDLDDDFDPDKQLGQIAFNIPEYLQFNWEHFRPIRIKQDTRQLESLDKQHSEKNEFIKFTALPAAIQFWTKTLMVYPAKRLFVDNTNCFLASPKDSWYGITGADLMLYIYANDDCSEANSNEQPLEMLAGSRSCDWDQYDRPIGGNIKLCYNSFELNDQGIASNETRSFVTHVLIHEIGHVLGLTSSDFAFYYDRNTGLPRTPRPLKPLNKEISCVNGKKSTDLPHPIYHPSSSTLQSGFDEADILYYEIVTPTVKRVAQNHYNCERMNGLRLENQPTSDDCYGDHWEERLAWDESMSASSSGYSIPESISPFTLALLEDTGWYRANFSMAKVISFGHGASCDFVEKPCIVDNKIPKYSEGYFCNSTDKIQDFMCDPTQSSLTVCDLYDLSNDEGQKPTGVSNTLIPKYFTNNMVGPKIFKLADFCPMPISPLLSCKQPIPSHIPNNFFIFPEETFGAKSRCVYSNFDRPLCVEITCNEEENAIIVNLNDREVKCSYDGEKIELDNIYHFVCPRKAAICPELMCPGNCSGRGVCQWNTTTPSCKCFDERETNKNCNNYTIGSSDLSYVPIEEDVEEEKNEEEGDRVDSSDDKKRPDPNTNTNSSTRIPYPTMLSFLSLIYLTIMADEFR